MSKLRNRIVTSWATDSILQEQDTNSHTQEGRKYQPWSGRDRYRHSEEDETQEHNPKHWDDPLIQMLSNLHLCNCYRLTVS